MSFKLKIALDYDRTYKREPELFLKIVRLFIEAGHTVYVVTMSSEKEALDIDIRLKQLAKAVLATNHQAKFEFVKRLDIWIDIWIDDNPAALFDNYLARLDPPVTILRQTQGYRQIRTQDEIPKRRRTDRDQDLINKGND